MRQFEFFKKWSWNDILSKIHHHSLRYINHSLSHVKRQRREGWTKWRSAGLDARLLLSQFPKELWSKHGQSSHCIWHDSSFCVIAYHTRNNNQRGWWLEFLPTANPVARQQLLLWRDVGGTWWCLPQTVNVFIWFKNHFTTKSEKTLAHLCKHAENWTGRVCEESTREVLEHLIKLNTIC